MTDDAPDWPDDPPATFDDLARRLANWTGATVDDVVATLAGESGTTAQARLFDVAEQRCGIPRERLEDAMIAAADGQPATVDSLADARWRQFAPVRFHAADLDSLDTDAKRKAATAFADDPTRPLLLLGPVGVGKTWTAFAAVREGMRRKTVSGFEWFDTGSLLREMEPYGRDPLVARCYACPVLILDALGDEPLTDHKVGRLYDIVNRRWMNRLGVIVTSNLDARRLAEAVGARTWSRLSDSARTVTFNADRDRRRT